MKRLDEAEKKSTFAMENKEENNDISVYETVVTIICSVQSFFN